MPEPLEHLPPAGEPTTAAVVAATPRMVAAPTRKLLRITAATVLVVAVFGLAARQHLVTTGLADPVRPPPWNIFYRLYALHEQPHLVLLIPFALLLWWSTTARGAMVLSGWGHRLEQPVRRWHRTPAWVAALAVLLVSAAGTVLVMHEMPLSMDEFAGWFQARIFASGRVTAPVPDEWQPLAPWMTPIFITYKPDLQVWVSAYLPVYSALRALPMRLGADWLVNPLLAGWSVLLIHRAASRMWPGEHTRASLAVVLLATSSQFLVMSMSGYAMPAHLALNLLWLTLYLRDDRLGYAILPLVGVVAMGLHNPFPHALFVVPFLVRLLRHRRFGVLAYAGVIYLAGAAAWLRWLQFSTAASAQPAAGSSTLGGFLGSFAIPGGTQRFVQALDVTLLFSWQTPVLGALMVVALASWRHLQKVERDLAASFLLTFAFYALFPIDQGHGWGYRYVYGALGNVALLGATGAAMAASRLRAPPVRALLAASLGATLLLQLPLRLTQVESFVRPWAHARDFMADRPEPLVAVDFQHGWYAADLVRNDPLFERGPRVIAFNPAWRAELVGRVPASVGDSVYVITRPHLERLGLPLVELPAAPTP